MLELAWNLKGLASYIAHNPLVAAMYHYRIALWMLPPSVHRSADRTVLLSWDDGSPPGFESPRAAHSAEVSACLSSSQVRFFLVDAIG